MSVAMVYSADVSQVPRPLRWWSTESLRSLARVLDPVWQSWAGRWGITVQPVRVLNAQDAVDGLETATWQPWLADGAAASPWAWVSSPTNLSLGDHMASAMFGAASDALTATRGTQPSMATDVAGQATREFESDLARALGRAPFSALSLDGFSAGSALRVRPWSGDVRVHLRGDTRDGIGFWVHLDVQAVEAAMTTGTGNGPLAATPFNPVTVVQALAGEPLRLNVELNPTEIDLGTLQGLRLGDVLTLNHRLEEPLAVRLLEAETGMARDIVCAAHLGLRDGRRAVELVSASPATKSE